MVEVPVKEVEKIEFVRTCPDCEKALIKLKNGNFKCFQCGIEIEK